jgi:hypothetical protein
MGFNPSIHSILVSFAWNPRIINRIQKNVIAKPNKTLITRSVKKALHVKNIQNNIAITHSASIIHRLVIPASLAFSQLINNRIHFIIAHIHNMTMASDAINSHISGIHNSKNQIISVMIESIRRTFLLLYSAVVRATNNPMAHAISISILIIRIIILNDILGWKNKSIQNKMKNIPFIQKNNLIFDIF